MLFNSIYFILFLPIVLVLFYSIGHRYRPIILLLASYYFYISWNPVYIVLILTSTIIDYSAGILLSQTTTIIKRKLIVAASIFCNMGLLFYFKYANFFIENINVLASFYEVNPLFQSLEIILPIGISFYTFQTVSYTIDVYNNRIKSEKNLAHFALYVCFFPQLVAGPIERFSKLSPQLKSKAKLTGKNLSAGFRLILYGFFMKMVIADNIGVMVDHAYSNISNMHSLQLIFAVILYSFQIYCDFHGYSTIAIGAARLFNVNLSDNFRGPYFASSLTRFWRKWHITLTSWFRDYVYFPIGGNKHGYLRWVCALLVVFITSGLWHGANWTFVIWGGLHGILTLTEKILNFDKKSKSQLVTFFRMIFTFFVVSALWILFRSPNLTVAKEFVAGILSNWNLDITEITSGSHISYLETMAYLIIFLIVDYFTRNKNFSELMNETPVYIRYSIYFIMFFLILSRSGTDMQPFIYFQF